MADLEDVTLDGRPLQSLRVADLKAALEERGLSKSGQKNTLIKRLKGALMLENLQRTSTTHVGLQPNSQIGEEMSQNSFIKQYLAKQQELLRQRLEREAREAYDTNEQQAHTEVNNSTPCPPQVQDVKPASAEEHRPPGPSGGDGLFGTVNDREANRNQDADMSTPASGSVAMRVPGGDQQPERRSTSNEVVADSDDEDSEDGEEDGDDDDWDSGAGRRSLRQPSRAPMTRERSGASCQPQQQHMPSLLSPQLRQPTPPPSPPPELSFPLPDTPKQSPPSPDVAPPRRSPSTSSSGSSSSDSRSSSPEPQRSGHADRKPGPLTLLARKMASEGAFSGVGWHGAEGEADRQDSSTPSATAFPGRGPPEGLVSAITHTANTAGHVPYPMYPGTAQAVTGSHLAHIQVPVSVLKATATDERDRRGENELERERTLQLERQRKLEQEQAMEEERKRALALEREERERALEQERIERQLALEKEEREKALQRERELALERERQERELALAREREEQERARVELERQRALELERQEELERQRVLEQERIQREKEERERREREEMERALELERLERERALEQERLARERALEQERLERERILEQERLERERILEQERLERERVLEQERQERERIERERALEQERLERERVEREQALEQERLERERALEQERLAIERALEQERMERERALEHERLERERALEQERLELERQEKERIEREKALEQERMEREKALEKERMEREAVLEQEKREKERAEKERIEKEREQERALEDERREREKALQKEEQEKEKAKMAEKERESHLPPSKRGRDIGLTPLPTPSPLFTGPGRKPSTEAGEQDDAHAPMARSEDAELGAPLSPTPLSPQSPFKKFRILRDTQAQPQSAAASMVIKQPLKFSDSPQPQATPASSSSDSHQPFAEQEAVAAGTRPEKEARSAKTPEADKATGLELEEKQKGGSVQGEPISKEFTSKEVDENQGPASPEDATRQRGRDAKREEKQARRRSSSNDSSSSESDSGSTSSRSSGSSTSSQEKSGSPSRDRRERKHVRDSSPQRRETPETRAEDLKETHKASPCRREASMEKNDATTDDTCTKPHKRLIEASTVEETPKKRKFSEGEEEKDKQRPMESVKAESEKLPETSEEAPKAFSARKISLSNNKSSPGTGSAEGEQESGTAAGRKRRWGSSTAVTTKKPSISITTDSLKSLIPDIRPCLGQDAVVDLHPEEAVLSGAEDEEREHSDQDLQIRRTVTQVVHSESQENGQEAKRGKYEEEDELQAEEERTRANEEKQDPSLPAAMETQSPSETSHDVETNTVTPSDTLVRRSISQQKMGVSITIDDPVRTARQPSPPRGKVSSIVHISNLVRPFTLGQLKELLGRTGTLVEDGFWIDKIKSHCYVTYCSSDEAVATRAALHGVKWPQSNPKVLRVDFCQQDELDFHKGLGTADRPAAEEQGPVFGRGRAAGLPSLLPERDQWAEREREMERREKARAEREWDRDKVREFGKPGDEKEGGARRSRSRERRRKERAKSKEKKTEKKEKPEDPPAKLLDDLFRKTKAAPCIYWLPLTEEQFIQREADRAERMKEREKRTKEREKRRKEQEEEEEKKREEERKERMKAGGSGGAGERSEGEKDRDRERDRDRGRERDRERERDNDKRRDGYRRPGGSGAGGGRRSRSRSDPRDRRR